MKRVCQHLIITILLLFGQNVFTQTLHPVQVNNFSFTPSQLTIIVGDTVRWTNISGLHSVIADDSSFTSGPPSSSHWVYDFVFNTVGTYPYYCKQHGGPGGVGMSGVITVQPLTGIDDLGNSIYKFELKQNYPNPFNPITSISYHIPFSSSVTLKVYNALGKEVAILVNGEKPAGSYNLNWNAANLPSGIYFYKLQAGSFVETRKMILLK